MVLLRVQQNHPVEIRCLTCPAAAIAVMELRLLRAFDANLACEREALCNLSLLACGAGVASLTAQVQASSDFVMELL